MTTTITEDDLAQYRNVVDQNNKSIIRVPKEVKPLLVATGWISGKVELPFVPPLLDSEEEKEEEKKDIGKKKKKRGGGGKKTISILHSIGKDDWELSRRDLFSFNKVKEGERLDIFLKRLKSIDIENVPSATQRCIILFKSEWYEKVFAKLLNSKKKKAGDNVALGLGQWLFGSIDLWSMKEQLKNAYNDLEDLRITMNRKKSNWEKIKTQHELNCQNQTVCKSKYDAYCNENKNILEKIKNETTEKSTADIELIEILQSLFGINTINKIRANDDKNELQKYIAKMVQMKTYHKTEEDFLYKSTKKKTIMSISLHVNSNELYDVSLDSGKTIPVECRNAIERVTLATLIQTISIPLIDMYGGTLMHISSCLSHFTAAFDNADDAVIVAMCIKDRYNSNSPSNGGALDSHRLSIYLDQGNEYALKHCGASKLFYREHKRTYAMSSRRHQLWNNVADATPIHAIVFCSEVVEDRLSEHLGTVLYFHTFNRFLKTLNERDGFDGLKSFKLPPKVVDNVVLSTHINMIQSVNSVKCFSRLLCERTGLNRPRVCAQMWSDISHLYWRSIGLLAIRCIDDGDDDYDKSMRWDQPVTPKLLQKEIKIEYYHNHKKHIDNERKIEIENEITNICENLSSSITFDDTFNQLVNQRNALHDQDEEKINKNQIFPTIVKIQPMNISLLQPLRICASCKISNLVDLAFSMLKFNNNASNKCKGKKMKKIKCYLTWGPALITDEADFVLGPVIDRMDKIFRYKPKRKAEIPNYKMKLKKTGLIFDNYANQSIKHEKKILPHTNWMVQE
jgi:hypothetical protein